MLLSFVHKAAVYGSIPERRSDYRARYVLGPMRALHRDSKSKIDNVLDVYLCLEEGEKCFYLGRRRRRSELCMDHF